MRANEIPPDQWKDALDAFSKKHEGWIVTLEVVGAEVGDQEVTDRLPLVGIGADVKAGERRVHISLGGRRDAHLTKIIERPARVWLTEDDIPSHDAVAVATTDGTTTIVRFRHVDPAAADLEIPGNPKDTGR